MIIRNRESKHIPKLRDIIKKAIKSQLKEQTEKRNAKADPNY